MLSFELLPRAVCKNYLILNNVADLECIAAWINYAVAIIGYYFADFIYAAVVVFAITVSIFCVVVFTDQLFI